MVTRPWRDIKGDTPSRFRPIFSLDWEKGPKKFGQPTSVPEEVIRTLDKKPDFIKRMQTE